MNELTCQSCYETLPVEEFEPSQSSDTGYKKVCRFCKAFGPAENRSSDLTETQKRWGCNTPQEPLLMSRAWKRAMGDKKFTSLKYK